MLSAKRGKKPSRLRGYLLFQRARIASTFNLILVADNYSLFEFFFSFLSIRDAYDTRRIHAELLIRTAIIYTYV